MSTRDAKHLTVPKRLLLNIALGTVKPLRLLSRCANGKQQGKHSQRE
jgi:hypothetical protein